MKVLIVNNGTSYLKELEMLFAGNAIRVIESSQITETKSGDAECIVLSGGHGLPVMDRANPYLAEINFIRNSSALILGICLGYELIARAFGANLELMERREKGILEISPIPNDPMFKNIRNFSVYESHRWVVNKLPKNLVGLARSRDGYEIIKHREKPIYGFQFHPEMLVDQTSGDEIFKNFLDTADRYLSGSSPTIK